MRVLLVTIFAALVLVSAPRASHAEGKQEDTALALSLGGTVASWSLLLGSNRLSHGRDEIQVASVAVGALGALVAPSFGHWYAGGGLTRGFKTRLVSTLALIGATALAVGCIGDEGQGDGCHEGGMLVLGAAGAIGFAVGTIDDIATAPARARARNEWMLVPALRPTGGTVSLTGRF